MDNKKKKSWIINGLIAVVAIGLFVTGLHTEVIGFAQRGLLATGLMNPDVEELAELRNDASESDTDTIDTKADFNLQLRNEKGNIVSMESLKGKVIFLNFWATWCPPCIAEMPNIDKLHEEMGDEVAFVLLSFDDNFEKAKAFNKRKGYDLPIYAPASNLPAMYQSSALPTTYIIDANGNLALTHKGMADYSDPEFKEFLNTLK
ncbi:Thiol-disulfide isomerase or thioredoxin [Flavobacteriaceae bacterium MAR_2010_188]|nr:Thiol-disulfide isomerase or thioredoxin [Flavobacteriaceae bacterium MAR_2010_188]